MKINGVSGNEFFKAVLKNYNDGIAKNGNGRIKANVGWKKQNSIFNKLNTNKMIIDP